MSLHSLTSLNLRMRLQFTNHREVSTGGYYSDVAGTKNADEQEYSVYGSYKSKKMCVPRWGRGDIQAYG